MKKIGIIGGLGPESTVEYYKRIIYGYKDLTGDENYPQLFVNSLNMTEIVSYLTNNDYEKLINVLADEINKLETMGADYVAIASNTPHIVADEVLNKINVPLISIVEETCKYAKNHHLKKVLLTGTAYTMKNTFYQKVFNKYEVECVVPEDNEQKLIHNIIFPDLEHQRK
jgi:aspartate racemase